jgi:hypothetical protein
MEIHHLFVFSLHNDIVNKYCEGGKKVSMPGETGTDA